MTGYFSIGLVLLATLGAASAGGRTARPPGAQVQAQAAPLLLQAADISRLRSHPAAYAELLRTATAKLDYQPQPVAVLAPDPHYSAAGVNEGSSPVRQLAADAQLAYRAGLCYLLTDDPRFAATAQRVLDAWATTLRQVNTPQGKDDVNFNLPYMILAASWVRGAGSWNSAPFDRWLTTTVLPVSQAANPNNHGQWGVLLDASAAAYLGDAARLTTARQRWQALLRGAVAPDGSLPAEVQRSGTSNWRGGPDKGLKGLAYTHYALLPASLAAQVFASQGQPVWQTAGGRLLQAAFTQAAAWTLHPDTFPYYASNGGHLVGVRDAAYFALLVRHYPNPAAEAVLRQGNLGLNGFRLLELFGPPPGGDQ